MALKEKKLSIIVSLYNSDNFIDQFLEKIQQVDLSLCIVKIFNFINSHNNKELISQKLASLNNDFFEIIEIEEDLDLYDTWNKGIQESNTQFVSNLNIDDYVDNQYYNKCINFLENNNDISLVSSNFITYNKNNVEKQYKHFETYNPFTLYKLNELIYYDKKSNQFKKKNIPHCSPVWKKELHDKYGFFDSKNFDFVGDFEFWSRCLSKGETFANINEFLIYNYQDNGTASDRIWYDKNKEYIEKSTDFPYEGYKPTHLGKYHDRIHYLLNRKVINMYKPKLSVLIPLFNKEEHILKTIDSVLNQDYKDVIILICDDKSTDNSLEKVKTLNLNKIITFQNENNSERSKTRNNLIKYCDTDYFIFLDADDTLHLNSLNKLMTFETNQNQLAFGNFIKINNGKESLIKLKPLFDEDSFQIGWPSFTCVLYNKKLKIPEMKTEYNNFGKFKAGEDWEWLYELVKENKLVLKNIDYPLIEYNIGASTTYKSRAISILDTIEKLFDKNLTGNITHRILEFFTVCVLNNENINDILTKYSNDLKEKINNTELIKTNPMFWYNLIKTYSPNIKKFNFDLKILNSYLHFKLNIYKFKEDIFYKRLIDKFLESINDNRFEEIHVLGNGPSLKEYDFNLLKNPNILTIGMNLAYRFWETIDSYPKVYCCLDSVVLEHNIENVYKLIEEDKIELFYVRNLIYDKYPNLIDNPKVITYEEIGNKLLGLYENPILTTGSDSMKLGISLYPKKLIIFGIDCNYVEIIDEAKIDVKDGKEILVINKDIKTNPNYFFDGYQQKGDKYNIPDPNLERNQLKYGGHLHMIAFNQININFNRSNLDMKLFNGSQISKIPYFERIVY